MDRHDEDKLHHTETSIPTSQSIPSGIPSKSSIPSRPIRPYTSLPCHPGTIRIRTRTATSCPPIRTAGPHQAGKEDNPDRGKTLNFSFLTFFLLSSATHTGRVTILQGRVHTQWFHGKAFARQEVNRARFHPDTITRQENPDYQKFTNLRIFIMQIYEPGKLTIGNCRAEITAPNDYVILQKADRNTYTLPH